MLRANYVHVGQKKIKIYFLLGCHSSMAVWIGDGLCDNENNNEACEFDRGDCHESNAPHQGKTKSNQPA